MDNKNEVVNIIMKHRKLKDPNIVATSREEIEEVRQSLLTQCSYSGPCKVNLVLSWFDSVQNRKNRNALSAKEYRRKIKEMNESNEQEIKSLEENKIRLLKEMDKLNQEINSTRQNIEIFIQNQKLKEILTTTEIKETPPSNISLPAKKLFLRRHLKCNQDIPKKQNRPG